MSASEFLSSIPSFDSINPIFFAYAALTLLALLPIYLGSFAALEEIKVSKLSRYQ